MAIADTRVSRSAENVLTEHGPKILPVEVTCKEPGPSGFFDTETFRAKFGFAYSGSTLCALSTHALANTFFSNLVGNPSTPPPFLSEIAFAIAGVSAEYMREVGQLAGNNAFFQAIVFGFCPRLSKPLAFELSPQIQNSTVSVQIHQHNFEDEPDEVIIIGSNPNLLKEKIAEARETSRGCGDHPIVFADMPTRVLQGLINSGEIPSVGGAIQQAWSTPAGFELVAKMVPIKPRPPSTRNAALLVLGFDLLDLQNIGAYRVSMVGR